VKTQIGEYIAPDILRIYESRVGKADEAGKTLGHGELTERDISTPPPPLPPQRTHALSISIPYHDGPEIEETEVEILENL
jgi:hypothetical protein